MLIEIIGVPNGPAPEEVKKEWVGVRMEARPSRGGEFDFTTEQSVGVRENYLVITEAALAALEEKSAKAAAWFRKNIPPEMPFLTFGRDEVKVV